MKVGSDGLRYEVAEGWGDLPDGYRWGQVAAVCGDEQDRVLVFCRTEHPLLIFDREGSFQGSLGEGLVEDPHGMCLGPNGAYFFVDRAAHAVAKVGGDGTKLFELGSRHHPSDTGWTPENRTVLRPAGPFNYPTDVALAGDGGFYVSDGYRNARVHKFDSAGELVFSWGEPGSGPGQFNLVHSVWEHGERVYVADRENHRIQVFTLSGAYLDQWSGFVQPTDIYIDRQEIVYVSELGGRVSLLDLTGAVIARIGSPDERSPTPGRFVSPHGIFADRHGDFYVSEVTTGQRIQKFVRI
jgi:DNA-binding beta-propeller fold protein YncE